MSIRQYQVSADVDPKAYQYKSIDPNKQIRIVELLPGKFHAPIELKITEEDLNAEYDALSYTWGDHNSRVSISIKVDNLEDTKSINVTRNLNALCINQKDSAEKAHQVAMMTQIYKNADQVRIWLGPEADGSDLAMQTLRRGGDKMLGEDLMGKKNNRTRRALEALPRRDYWTRVWVVQEIFMARSIKIHCGKFEVDWNSAAEVFPEFLKARADLLVRNISQDDIRREQERRREQNRRRERLERERTTAVHRNRGPRVLAAAPDDDSLSFNETAAPQHIAKQHAAGAASKKINLSSRKTGGLYHNTNDQILEALEAVVNGGSDQSNYEFRRKSYRRRFAVFERCVEHKRPKDDEPPKDDEVPKDNTEKLMAMVPEDAKKGDSLYQLGSCEYWVLLRPIVIEVPCFHFVGPVYLAETPSWLKGNKNTPKWISLH
ncbi:Ankyrin and HET domain-containing protein [Lasiodiplodia theobromae]|uniref:Ankyrin and HET domain-containing protein n=1 Tax=Lasiodiplodia theobromae TaxID=45133 RepID=UPI0015C4085C|nr:Ankyrin and HET domain-containing protein [Lasiodiplodia theobromae]KAF4541794.1 Ankyrin and HET domain-containing protein [Lasiodiplodia theobromae]